MASILMVAQRAHTPLRILWTRLRRQIDLCLENCRRIHARFELGQYLEQFERLQTRLEEAQQTLRIEYETAVTLLGSNIDLSDKLTIRQLEQLTETVAQSVERKLREYANQRPRGRCGICRRSGSSTDHHLRIKNDRPFVFTQLQDTLEDCLRRAADILGAHLRRTLEIDAQHIHLRGGAGSPTSEYSSGPDSDLLLRSLSFDEDFLQERLGDTHSLEQSDTNSEGSSHSNHHWASQSLLFPRYVDQSERQPDPPYPLNFGWLAAQQDRRGRWRSQAFAADARDWTGLESQESSPGIPQTNGYSDGLPSRARSPYRSNSPDSSLPVDDDTSEINELRAILRALERVVDQFSRFLQTRRRSR